MKRLTLDQFKKKTEVSKEKTKELEKLTGGVLASCHCTEPSFPYPWEMPTNDNC